MHYPRPDAYIGAYHFHDLYSDEFWQTLMQYFAWALHQEIESARTPRKYLADENRFRQFFTDHVRQEERLGVKEEVVEDLLPYVYEEFFGIGLFREFLDDPEVEDIIMDSADHMDVVKGGRKHRISTPFADDADAIRWMQRLMNSQGTPISPHNPVENGQLSDGSRIICLIPPVVPTPGLAIRKHRIERFAPETYRASGIAPVEFFDDLAHWVRSRLNIIISGATGSGKTTFINYTGALIDEDDRVLVVEDTPELRIPHPRAYSMTTTARGSRLGRGEEDKIKLGDLVGHTLRMKPDRIIVGEVRGAEAFDLLNAMNTGHDGSLSTLHSNSPAEAILRIESLAAPAQPNMPLWALQDLIANTIGIIIQLKQLPGTSHRRVVEAAQVIHPAQADDPSVLAGCRKLRDNVYLNTLWRWSAEENRLMRMNEYIPLADQYFMSE